ncbi:MAG: type III-B CRISPR module RAMP protein Cmr6 [Labilithrix sp.]|nr:type III-B CRISPR module RAMP protein Cmr6 [Labilithrix sp.]MBX3216448.1 type III-B CRISPR module RAMP protein Cmr6 [Labilithrix sp.]
MSRPLYARVSRAEIREPIDNTGLWFDKFCDRWSDAWSLKDEKGSANDSGKVAWLRDVARRKSGEKRLLDEALRRRLELTTARRGQFGIFKLESPFVTGIGRSHPVENGFAWHPTLGVPYLPGSSVKGLVRAWASAGSGTTSSTSVGLANAFDDAGGAGTIIFLDAIPIEPVGLEVDVMTPHFHGWTKDAPPGDWRSPTPVPFLVTAPSARFAFSILPRTEDVSDVARAFECLREALEHTGAGAKTAVGYGRFSYEAETTRRRRDELEAARRDQAEALRRAEARRTPEGRWAVDLEGQSEREILEIVRLHLEKEPLVDPADRRALAGAVASTGLLAFWRRGSRRDASTNVGSAKLKERARIVDAALRT